MEPRTVANLSVDDGDDGSHAMDFYSRQIHAIGTDTLKQLQEVRVLVVGCGAVGMEVVKNVTLFGVGCVGVMDDTLMSERDRGLSLYVDADDIGQRRSEVCVRHAQKLNQYVHLKVQDTVTVESEELNSYTIIVVTDKNLSKRELEKWGDRCRLHTQKFVRACAFGVFWSLFCDFGPSFMSYDVLDQSGELVTVEDMEYVVPAGGPARVHIRTQTNLFDTQSTVSLLCRSLPCFTLDREFHFENEGRGWINIEAPRDLESFDTFKGPAFIRVNPHSAEFKSECFADSVNQLREMVISAQEPIPHADCAQYICFRSNFIMAAQLAVFDFIEEYGRPPRPRNTQDTEACVSLSDRYTSSYEDREGCRTVVRSFATLYGVEFAPTAACIGSIAAEEVIKSVGKYMPSIGWSLGDFGRLLDDGPLDTDIPVDRYYDMTAVLGKSRAQKLHELNWLVLGCGALGCELLSHFALLGVATSTDSMVHIVDLDTVSRSNLNRQYLFRPEHINQSKAIVAKHTLSRYNPDIHITEYNCDIESEEIGEAVWSGVAGYSSTLDNTTARVFVDSQSRKWTKPMMDCGTKAHQGQAEAAIPHKTATWQEAAQEDNSNEVPSCTLRNFPNHPHHAVTFARSQFNSLFGAVPELLLRLRTLSLDEWIEDSLMNEDVNNPAAIGLLCETIVEFDGKFEWKACLNLAYKLYFLLCYIPVRNIQISFPEDFSSNNGIPFYSGMRSYPMLIDFNIDDPDIVSFITETGAILAHCFGVDCEGSCETILRENDWRSFLDTSLVIEQYDPDEDLDKGNHALQCVYNYLETNDCLRELLLSIPIKPERFEKDDFTNHHVQFVHYFSRLRQRSFHLPTTSFFETKTVAGHIIPAIVTTTVTTASLSVHSIVSYLLGVSAYSMYLNLALSISGGGLIDFEAPLPQEITSGEDPFLPTIAVPNPHTNWDQLIFKISTSTTMAELIDLLEKEFEPAELSILSIQTVVLFMRFGDKYSREEERNCPVLKKLEKMGCDQLGSKIEIFASLERDDYSIITPSMYLQFTS